MRKNFFENVDKKLLEDLKAEYKKLSNVDRENVLNTTNDIVDGICGLLGIEDADKYHITDDLLNDVSEACKEKCAEVKETCTKVKEKCSEKLASVNREEAIAQANSVIKSTLKSFGVKDVDKYLIDPSDEDLKITVAEFGDPIDLTCADMGKDGCYNESCDTCDGKCRNEECNVSDCPCNDETGNADADNEVDAPARTNIPRVNLNLSAAKKKTNTKQVSKPAKDGLLPELTDPAGSRRSMYNEMGDKVIGANPYAESENAKQPIKPCLADIKKRLQTEAKQVVEDNNSTMIKAFKETLVSKITGILEDDKTHNYTVHPKSEKTPAAVEVTLEDITSGVRNNIYILSEIETELKNLYDFPEVHINVSDTDDEDYVNLTVFMVLE